MPRRIAKISVSPELLVQALHLPEGTRIFHADTDTRCYPFGVFLYVEHEHLPEVPEGQPMPEASPLLESDNQGNVRFLSWRT